nr:hypothetical protein [uncultured archaeon]
MGHRDLLQGTGRVRGEDVQQEPHDQDSLLPAVHHAVQLLGDDGPAGLGRATAYRYRDCMAEEAVEGMSRAGAGTWIRVDVAMGAG